MTRTHIEIGIKTFLVLLIIAFIAAFVKVLGMIGMF